MVRIGKIENPRWPHRVRITRTVPGSYGSAFAADGAPAEDVEEVLYDGSGRSYTDTTTEGNSAVDENKRKASIPVRFDGWAEGKFPLDGDTIEVWVGSHSEVGTVKDCEGDNNRSVVYWDLRRV